MNGADATGRGGGNPHGGYSLAALKTYFTKVLGGTAPNLTNVTVMGPGNDPGPETPASGQQGDSTDEVMLDACVVGSVAPGANIFMYFTEFTTQGWVDALQDAITGATYSVAGGNISITLAALTGVVLLPAPVTVDLTAPLASISTTPGANGKGWINHSPATVNLSATDSGSGVQQLRYWINNGQVTAVAGSTASTNVSGEGSYGIGLRALDNAGNISSLASLSFGIDVTPPVVMVTGVTQGAIYMLGSVPAAGCTTSDALSGVGTSATVKITGGNGHGEGQFTATCSGATDNAGNVAPPRSVTYDVVSNISSSVNVLTQFHANNNTSGTMTVRNTSENNINLYGPIQVVLTQLPAGVTVANPTGSYLGNPYITVPGVTTLVPGASASVQVQFNNPANVKVRFTSTTYSGQFN